MTVKSERVNPRMLVFHDTLRNAFQLGHGAAPLPLVGRTQPSQALTGPPAVRMLHIVGPSSIQ